MRRDKQTLRKTRDLLQVREVEKLAAAQAAETARQVRDERAAETEAAQMALSQVAEAWMEYLGSAAMDPGRIEDFGAALIGCDEDHRRASTRLAGAERALSDQSAEHRLMHAHVEAIRVRRDAQSRKVQRRDEEDRQTQNEDRLTYRWRQT